MDRATIIIAQQKLAAIRTIHRREEFGDCVEDGELFPCRTVQVLDWEPATPPTDTPDAMTPAQYCEACIVNSPRSCEDHGTVDEKGSTDE